MKRRKAMLSEMHAFGKNATEYNRQSHPIAPQKRDLKRGRGACGFLLKLPGSTTIHQQETTRVCWMLLDLCIITIIFSHFNKLQSHNTFADAPMCFQILRLVCKVSTILLFNCWQKSRRCQPNHNVWKSLLKTICISSKNNLYFF